MLTVKFNQWATRKFQSSGPCVFRQEDFSNFFIQVAIQPELCTFAELHARNTHTKFHMWPYAFRVDVVGKKWQTMYTRCILSI